MYYTYGLPLVEGVAALGIKHPIPVIQSKAYRSCRYRSHPSDDPYYPSLNRSPPDVDDERPASPTGFLGVILGCNARSNQPTAARLSSDRQGGNPPGVTPNALPQRCHHAATELIVGLFQVIHHQAAHGTRKG